MIAGAAACALIPGFLYGMYASAAGTLPRHAAFTQIPVRILLISQLVSYVPLIWYLCRFVPRLAGRTLAELGVRVPRGGDILAGLGGTFFMLLIVGTSSWALTSFMHQHTTEAAVVLLRSLRTPGQVIAFISIAVLFAPMVEEFAFRVFLFNAISRHTSTKIGAILSSLIFGYVHGTDITVALPLAFGGLALARVYIKTGCYWASVITHACFNAVSVVAVLVFHATN